MSEKSMTFTDAINNQLIRLRLRYAKTPLPGFFSWWWSELVGMLPQRWRVLFAEHIEELLIEVRGRSLAVWRQTSERCADFGRVALDDPAEQQRAEFARLREQIDDPNLRTYYCIAPQRGLRRSLTLPIAAEDKLRQVLSFEMDRQTPFKADQVYFDYVVADRDLATKSLKIDLTVVPKTQLDAELAPLIAAGAALDGVDCWQAGPGSGRMGLNLLPTDRRLKHSNARLRLNLGLAAAALVLLIIGMNAFVSNRQAALAAMTVDVDKAKGEAKQVSDRKKALQDTIASANFLNHRKIANPLMTVLLDDLTKRLPDDTFLERLTVDEKGKVEMQGMSANASHLIDLLQKSEVVINPAIQGTIQPDPRTKKERFTLAAQLRGKEGVKDADVDDKTVKPVRNRGANRAGGADASVANSP